MQRGTRVPCMHRDQPPLCGCVANDLTGCVANCGEDSGATCSETCARRMSTPYRAVQSGVGGVRLPDQEPPDACALVGGSMGVTYYCCPCE